jgi:branched-subunit amino acid aminotransferase/4-amino-4-deoxychorismate lyase
VTTGIFETMRAVNGRVPLLDRHLARLRASAAALGLDCPADGTIVDQIAAALAGSGIVRVRLDLTTDATVRVEASPMPENRPVRLALVPGFDPSAPTRHKTRDRTDYAAAVHLAQAAGADHPLLISPEGWVGETDHANIFAVIRGCLVTPPVGGILAGVARGLVVARLGATVAPLRASDLVHASELFLTNALRGVIAVRSVDENAVSDGHIGHTAAALFQTIDPPPGAV